MPQGGHNGGGQTLQDLVDRQANGAMGDLDNTLLKGENCRVCELRVSQEVRMRDHAT